MIDVKTEVTIDGEVFQGEVGTIGSTFLGVVEHGIFTFILHFDFPGSGQGAGTYALDEWNEEKKRRIGSAVGLDFIMEVLRVAGVRQWEHLKDLQLMVLREDRWDTIRGLLNPKTNDVLIFKKHFKDWGIGD